MKPFDYLVPDTLQEALAALDAADGQALPIAGGQSLLLEMKTRTQTPSRLVSLSGLLELGGVRAGEDGSLVVGAGVSYATLMSESFPGWQGLLPAVAGNLADRPVRTMGTIGGALCQADPRFDMPTLTVGLDAEFDLASVRGRRRVAAADMFDPTGGLLLKPGEILLAIRFPELGRYSTAAFEKIRNRMFDAAVTSAVCALDIDPGGSVISARLTVGAVSPAPIVASGAAEKLIGRVPGPADIDAAAAAATAAYEAAVTPATRLQRYQHELVAVVVRRAIRQALDEQRS